MIHHNLSTLENIINFYYTLLTLIDSTSTLGEVRAMSEVSGSNTKTINLYIGYF